MPEILGRRIHGPENLHEWLSLIIVLATIAVAFAIVADGPSAVLGMIAGAGAFAIDARLFVPAAIAVAGATALVAGKRTVVERPGSRAFHEGTMIAAGFLVYEFGRAAFVGNEATARRHAERVRSLESRLGLAFEPSLQRSVVGHDDLLRLFNGVYSWGFMSFVAGVLFWLYLTDDIGYRLMRLGLGISALLALATIALYPVAPPRLTPDSGLLDSHALFGHGHGFVNPYAAIPSLHVGWTALAGFALGRNRRRLMHWALTIGPIALMGATVIVTGNHFWLDGLIGIAYAVVPVALLARMPIRGDLGSARDRLRRWAWAATRLSASRSAVGSLTGLGVLLAYLVVRQQVDPGFMHYWGYTVLQIALTIAVLLVVDVAFAAQGGLAWYTHLLVTADTWADTLGTAGHLYDRFTVYDKVTHFAGGLALTAAAADILAALARRGSIRWPFATRQLAAVAATMILNVGWETYEYLGDALLGTGRHQGEFDTTYDFASDFAGAIVVVLSLWWAERARQTAQPAIRDAAETTSPHADHRSPTSS
jgi:hypothetical protein